MKKYKLKNTIFGISNRWTHAAETPHYPRELRALVMKFNDQFGVDPQHDTYIVSGIQGYKVTNDLEEIRDAIEHDEYVARKAMNRIQKRKRGLKRLLNRRIHGGELA